MLDKTLRKAKWKQRLLMAAIAVVVVVILLPLSFLGLNTMASHETDELFAQLDAYHTVAEPNVSVASELLANNNSFGGNVITKEYKDIDGYMVSWGTYTSSYSNLQHTVDDSLGQTFSRQNQRGNSQLFSSNSMHKVPTFFTNDKRLPNEAKTLSALPNHVGEVAVTFDRGYTYAELKKLLPHNLNLTWGYLFNDSNQTQYTAGSEPKGARPAENPIGMNLTTFHPRQSQKWWRSALHRYWNGNTSTPAYRRVLKTSAATLKFRGVVLTGTTENLAKIATSPFVAGTSVGVTVRRVPYIKPSK